MSSEETSPADELLTLVNQIRTVQPAMVLAGAVDLGLIDALARNGPCSAEAIAKECGFDETGVALLLNCLVAIGCVEKSPAGDFRVAERFGVLLEGEASPIAQVADMFRILKVFADMKTALDPLRDHTDSNDRFAHPEAWTAQYLGRVEARNRRLADKLAWRLKSEVSAASTMLDIGGGHAGFVRAMQSHNPDLEATILDLPEAIQFCARRSQEEPFEGVVDLREGDARALDDFESFDIVLMSDLLHYFRPEEKREVLERALRATKAGGTLAISKFRLDSDGHRPPSAAFFAFQKYLETPNAAYLETDQDCIDMLQGLGAVNIVNYAADNQKSILLCRCAS